MAQNIKLARFREFAKVFIIEKDPSTLEILNPFKRCVYAGETGVFHAFVMRRT